MGTRGCQLSRPAHFRALLSSAGSKDGVASLSEFSCQTQGKWEIKAVGKSLRRPVWYYRRWCLSCFRGGKAEKRFLAHWW